MDQFGHTLWEPPSDARQRTRLGQFMDWLETVRGIKADTYEDLWRWSVTDLDGFWSAVADYFEVRFTSPPHHALTDPRMPRAEWFPGATLNYAEHALAGGRAHVWSRSQTRDPTVATTMTTAAELSGLVARARTGLQHLGVGPGDRVCAYLPNITETLVAFLASASLGAVWSSCPPEFGVRSVVDRFQQIDPKVLLAVDGYRYGAKAIDRRADVAEIRRALPSLTATVHVPYLDPASQLPASIIWDDVLLDTSPLNFESVPFDHPLYVLFSSGTTGLPKPIVHGHGGILLEHLKALGLHGDLGPAARFSWFTTTGWMMWNYLVSGLLVGSGIVLFDGDPGYPDLTTLWRMAAEIDITFLGVSAPFIMGCRKAGLRPGEEHDLHALRTIGSTGAPLPAEGFDWVYDAVKPDVLLSSISGGTDVCTAFVGGNPLLPVRSGVIACRYLGCKVEAFDADATSVVGEQGELVITEPMPSMPVGFWGDDDGSRYRAAYFEDYPGVWRHGDWITINEDGSCVITGRSDATLNRGGVRLGTSDFYAVVEDLPEVRDSLVVHLDDRGGEAGELVLFVVLAEGATLDDALRSRLAQSLRTQLSPRHVPDRIEVVGAVPRTLSGKKLEVPVKRLLQGAALADVASTGALANPESLTFFQPGS